MRDALDYYVFGEDFQWVIDHGNLVHTHEDVNCCYLGEHALPSSIADHFVSVDAGNIVWDQVTEPIEPETETNSDIDKLWARADGVDISQAMILEILGSVVGEAQFKTVATRSICRLLASLYSSDQPISQETALLLAGIAASKINGMECTAF